MPQTDRDRALTRAYGRATTRLREENKSRFNELYKEEALQEGEEWSPKLTGEEKAQAQIESLLAEHPGLRERLVGEPVAAEG